MRIVAALGAFVLALSPVLASKPSGSPAHTGSGAFPASLFSSMYFMPHGRTAEPRPAVPSGHGWYPDSLNNPTQLPMHAPSSEAVLPAQLHDGEQFDKLTHDLFNLAGQLFRLDGTTSLTCNLCRAGLSTLQALSLIHI